LTDDSDSGKIQGLDGGQASGAGRWILISRIVAQASQISLFLLAARYLTPAQFGLFALIQAFSSLLFVGASAGWRETIIGIAKSQNEINQLMAFSLISGVAMALTGGLIAIGLNEFNLPEAARLVALFCVCVFFAPAVNAFNGILVRQGRVQSFAVASIVAEALAFVVAAWALVAGMGVYALALGKITFLALSAALLAWRSGWMGKLAIRGDRTRLLLSSSAHVLANRTIAFLQSNSSTFLVGAFLGPVGVGFYRAAERVVSSVAELVMEPLRMIVWVELRRAADQSDHDDAVLRSKLSEATTRLVPLLIFLTAPVFIGLAFVARDLVVFALGPAWAVSGDIAAIFALGAFSSVPGVLAEPLMSLSGEIRRLPRIMLMNAAVGAGTLAIFGPFGLHMAAFASLPAGLFTIVTVFWILQRHGGFVWRTAFEGAGYALPPLLAMVVVVVGTRWITEQLSLSAITSLAAQVFAGAGIYLATLYMLRPGAFLELRKL
jgi:O-antigen/teichoic acid export membrane protein